MMIVFVRKEGLFIGRVNRKGERLVTHREICSQKDYAVFGHCVI